MAPPILSSKRYEPPPSPVVHTPIGDDGSVLESHASFDSPTHHPYPAHATHGTRRSSLELCLDGTATATRGPVGPTSRPFALRVDPRQGDRAVEIKLLSAARPHMRAFHFAWLSFFIAFFGWFSIPPLMPTIKTQLHLTKDQVANSNIAAVASTIAGRVVVGPLCDRYGPRVIQAGLLVVGAVPVACAAFASDYVSFVVVRFAIGLVGCSFVATTYWTSIIFSKEIVGSANALAAGWGNLGAGVTYLVTPLLFDLVTSGGVSDDIGWRITLVFPALFMVAVGVLLFHYSDDCPHGNFSDLRKLRKSLQGENTALVDTTVTTTTGSRDVSTDSSVPKPASVDVKAALWFAAKKPATWILAFQYACSFGIELQVHNVLSLYYYEDFTRDDCVVARDPKKCRVLTQTSASLISSLFGLMCIFARALGGLASDLASRQFGMKGRLVVQLTAFTGQAASLFVYSQVREVGWSIPALIIFGIFVQACTGTTFAIVPYVLPRYTGATSGIVGAGGNIGALCWGFLFKGVGDRAVSFQYLSGFVALAALLCAVTQIDNEGSIWRYADRLRVLERGDEAGREAYQGDDDERQGRLAAAGGVARLHTHEP